MCIYSMYNVMYLIQCRPNFEQRKLRMQQYIQSASQKISNDIYIYIYIILNSYHLKIFLNSLIFMSLINNTFKGKSYYLLFFVVGIFKVLHSLFTFLSNMHTFNYLFRILIFSYRLETMCPVL